jgi:chaperone modulatory protein CbpM
MMVPEHDALQRVVGVTEIRLRTWVSRGWVSPTQTETGYVYSELDIARCDLIRQLRDDLEIDRETVPVVLSLLDQVYGLRRELRALMRAVERQPESVRRQILDALD